MKQQIKSLKIINAFTLMVCTGQMQTQGISQLYRVDVQNLLPGKIFFLKMYIFYMEIRINIEKCFIKGLNSMAYIRVILSF